MADFSESLTIRILGDSSHFDRELQKVTKELHRFQDEMSEMSRYQDYFSRLGRQVNRFSRPLQEVSRLLDGITVKLASLSQYPIVLNVAPAMANLLLLSQMIDLLMAKLAALASFAAAAVGPSASGGGASFAETGGVQGFARGGYVSGPGGVDRVPAMLTAGEFVLRKPVAQQLGAGFLHSLNERGPTALREVSQATTHNNKQTDIHHYGGFTINVSQPIPVSSVLKTIKQKQKHTHTRRG